jgi:uncharacterized protein (DUF1800 family)
MTSAAERLAIRFGYGLPAGPDAGAILAQLSGPDQAAANWPGPAADDVWATLVAYQAARKAKDDDTSRALLGEADALALQGVKALLARAIGSPNPFRERLVAFWGDHFTVTTRKRQERGVVGVFIDGAIRPHVNGRFAAMLIAVVTHPAMLAYLDQDASFGPNSRRSNGGKRGLNENLARELLELHTLGVSAGYTQADVRELAELLTGLVGQRENGFTFEANRAEPGAETVLGVTYGDAGLDPILQALTDLAHRPETAAHLARKLAVHFVADDPDPALVAAIAARWTATKGDLLAVSDVLLNHPAAMRDASVKARQPFDFLVAGLRALGVSADDVMAFDQRQVKRLLLGPMAAMGQPLQAPQGPDGWPEVASHWITPQGLAARIDWAMSAPMRLVEPLPDPRALLRTALADQAGERLAWAVSAAESARDGVGLVLASPEFNRR